MASMPFLGALIVEEEDKAPKTPSPMEYSAHLPNPDGFFFLSLKQIKSSPRLYQGPMLETNWVFPDKLLVGAYPGAIFDGDHFSYCKKLGIKLKVRTFVSLQEEYIHNSTESEWRKNGVRPYIKDIESMLDEEHKKGFIIDDKLEMLHLPIKDGNICSDYLTLRLCENLYARLMRNEIIYIHCWGGHGRVGVIVSILISMLFQISAEEAMKFTQALHDCRVFNSNIKSPNTKIQVEQVERIVTRYLSGGSPGSRCLKKALIQPDDFFTIYKKVWN